MLESEICFMTATELAARIRAGELSASEVMDAHLDRIVDTEPLVNAIVPLLPEKPWK
jgi:amidase